MKKNKNKKTKRNIIEKINIEMELINLLVYENQILRKKQNKEELTKEERIFDTYLVSPSFLIRQIERRKTND